MLVFTHLIDTRNYHCIARLLWTCKWEEHKFRLAQTVATYKKNSVFDDVYNTACVLRCRSHGDVLDRMITVMHNMILDQYTASLDTQNSIKRLDPYDDNEVSLVKDSLVTAIHEAVKRLTAVRERSAGESEHFTMDCVPVSTQLFRWAVWHYVFTNVASLLFKTHNTHIGTDPETGLKYLHVDTRYIDTKVLVRQYCQHKTPNTYSACIEVCLRPTGQ